MDKARVELDDRSYDIVIAQGCLGDIGAALKDVIPDEKVLVVTDENVGPLYVEKVLQGLDRAGFDADSILLPAGESHKNMESVERIYNFLADFNYPRRSTIVALGGGVVGDIAGFAAATYMRGIHFVQVPTTLLAMVDSSVGGKTGVNHTLGKNLIGAFYQPDAVFVDTNVLQTLPQEELQAGLGEVIKYGMIRDADLFLSLEDNMGNLMKGDATPLERIIKRCCEIKAAIVAEDECEAGKRAILNFGHTVGHAVESLTNYHKYRHGEAVAIGMIAATRIAVKMEMFDDMESQRLWELIVKAQLPYRIGALDPEDIMDRMKKDKKVRSNKIRIVLPQKIGDVVIRDDVPDSAIREVLEGMSGDN